MKQNLILWLSLMAYLNVAAQHLIHPSVIFTTPDVTDDALARFEKDEQRFLKLMDSTGWEYDDLGLIDQAIVDRQMQFEYNAWYSGPLGCSWYCAGGPDSIWANSAIRPTKKNTYFAENVHDFDLKTAWVTNRKQDTLSLSFNLHDALTITEIHIYNGYLKSEALWNANSRVKTMDLLIDGAYLAKLSLEDSMFGQLFEIPEIKNTTKSESIILQFVIKEVYPGTKYSDICISEINFNGTGDH